MTKIHGAHTLKAGTDFRVLQATGPNAFFASGAYTFTNSFTQGPNPTQAGAAIGNSLASLLMGVGTGQAQINPRLLVSNNYFALFVQDDFRITRKLMLNIGLRYDLENGRSERFNQSSYFDFAAPSPLASQVPSLPNLRGGLKFVGVDGDPKRQFDTDTNNFGPRIGLAYTVTPGTVIRSGYGILYEPFIGRAASSGRMMWGTLGNNMEAYQRNITIFDQAFDFAPEAGRAKIHGLTALKVFGFKNVV
jgi:outer membrane receptor protein involved in Fe transport